VYVVYALTLFEAGYRDLRVFHINPPSKIHVREAFDHIMLPSLWYGMVEASDIELE